MLEFSQVYSIFVAIFNSLKNRGSPIWVEETLWPLSLSLLIWRGKRSWPVASLVFVHGVLLRPAMTAYSDCGFRTYDTDDDDDDDDDLGQV